MEMRSFFLKLFLCFSTTAANGEIVRAVNNEETRYWTAGKTRSLSKQYATGALWLPRSIYQKFPAHPGYGESLRTVIPPEFDARLKWPNCTSIGEVRAQGECGSCWAHAVAEVATDRLCIFSSVEGFNPHLSVEDLMSCCTKCGGCNGGTVELGFQYFVEQGIVTGSNFNDRFTGCRPYSFPDGEKTWRANMTTPTCRKYCTTGYRVPYKKDLRKGTTYFTLSKYTRNELNVAESEKSMQMEIMRNGPISCSMKVHEDFLTYKSGVYNRVTGKPIGGHAMKCIGWGTDPETQKQYWLVVNSWGTDWGENGLARILRGRNECGIESRAAAAIPTRYAP